MATRALIGYLDHTTNTITTTYNHYDGYPSNLGVALEKFYNSEEKAKEISNIGYISFLSPDTGEWDAINKQAPHIIELGNSDLNTTEVTFFALQQLRKLMDECWAEYAYIWNTKDNKWITFRYES